jgi:hypothetical protein
LALLVGFAGEAAGAVAAPNQAAAMGSDRGSVPERPRVHTDGFLANVAEPSAGQQPDVACRHARGAKRPARRAAASAERVLQSVVIEVISVP